MKFEYTEVNKKGEKTKAQITALSEKEALENLQKAGKTVIAMKKMRESVLFTHIALNKEKLLADFTESLSNMLSAGIKLVNALEIIYQEEKNAYMKNIVRDILVEIKKGKSFYQAVFAFPLFPSMYSALIRVGEETGKLKEVVVQLQSYTRKNLELRENILSSLYYPAFLMAMSLLTVLYLVIYVLPQLFGIFEGFGAKLPALTIAMMNIVSFIKNYFLWIAIGLTAAGVLLYRYAKTAPGRMRLEKILLKIPKIRDLYRVFLNIDFFKPLALLMKNKVHLNTALGISGQVTKSAVMQEVIKNIVLSVKKGEGIKTGELGGLVFSNSTLQMLSIGEKSGKLPDIVNSIEASLSEKSEQDIKRIVVLIEPVMILLIGLLIAFIVMSALLPIYSISTTVQ